MGTCSSKGKCHGLETQHWAHPKWGAWKTLPTYPLASQPPHIWNSHTMVSYLYLPCVLPAFLLRNISGGFKFLHCFSPHTHTFCFWLIFPCGWCVCSDLYLSFFWWGLFFGGKMYLFFKLVALGISRLLSLSVLWWVWTRLFLKLEKWVICRSAHSTGISWLQRFWELFVGLCNVCIVSKAWEVAKCLVHLLVCLLVECTGKAKTIKKKKNGILL